MKLTNDFNFNEFQCNDNSAMPIWVQTNIKLLAEELQKLRDELGRPIRINSAYRSPEYNQKVGGAKNSQHLYGKAADIVVKNMNPDEVADAIEFLIEEGKLNIKGLGRYNSFTHVDIRDNKARWDYRK
mgnify:CR=1 FL=1|tara:strand:- start:1808 stop:2191 length:384 start_codon:yes stop_codon:yes gene_type:complete